MCVFHVKQLEIFSPVGTLFRQRWIAKACFNPGRDAFFIHPRFGHVVDVFVAGNGSLAERFAVDRIQERSRLSRFDFRFDEVAHEET